MSGDQGKSEKQQEYLEIFVRIDRRQILEDGDHIPPISRDDSKTRGKRPDSKAAFADTRPAGPAPIPVYQITASVERFWGIAYDSDGLS
jgi:hypothetical protein